MGKKLLILIVVLVAVIIAASVLGAYQMEIGPFEEDDDDEDDGNGGNGPVDEGKPVAIISVNRTHADPNNPFMFDGSGSYDDESNVTDYRWNFDDGNTEDNHSVEHSWIQPGAYNVSLTVTDSDGNFNSTWIWIGITDHITDNGQIDSGSAEVPFSTEEMVTEVFVNMTVDHNVEDPDNNEITLNVYKGGNLTWTESVESGWTQTIERQFTASENLTAEDWSWELVVDNAGFLGSMDWEVEIAVIYV